MALLDFGPFRFRNLNTFFIESYNSLSFIYDLIILGAILTVALSEGGKFLGKSKGTFGGEKGGNKLGAIIGMALAFFVTLYIHQRGGNLLALAPALLTGILMVSMAAAWWKWIDPFVTKVNGDQPNKPLSAAIALFVFLWLLNALAGGYGATGSLLGDIYALAWTAATFLIGWLAVKWGLNKVQDATGTAPSDRMRNNFQRVGEATGKALKWGWNKLSALVDKATKGNAQLVEANQTAAQARNATTNAARKFYEHYLWIQGQNGIIPRLGANQRPTDQDLQRASVVVPNDANTLVKEADDALKELGQQCKGWDKSTDDLRKEIDVFQKDTFRKFWKSAIDVRRKMVEKGLAKKESREFKGDPTQQAVLQNEHDALVGLLQRFAGEAAFIRSRFGELQSQVGAFNKFAPGFDRANAAAQPLRELPTKIATLTQSILRAPTAVPAWNELSNDLLTGQKAAEDLTHALEDLAHNIDATSAVQTTVTQIHTEITQHWDSMGKLNEEITKKLKEITDKIAFHEKGEKLEASWKAALAVLEKAATDAVTLARDEKGDYERLRTALQALDGTTPKAFESAIRKKQITQLRAKLTKLMNDLASVDAGLLQQYATRLEAERSPPATVIKEILANHAQLTAERKEIDGVMTALSAQAKALADALKKALTDTDINPRLKELTEATQLTQFKTVPAGAHPKRQESASAINEAQRTLVWFAVTGSGPGTLRTTMNNIADVCEHILIKTVEYRQQAGR